jgi:hypothetical protein
MRTKIAYFVLVVAVVCLAGCAGGPSEGSSSPSAGSVRSDGALSREQAAEMIRNDPRFKKTVKFSGSEMVKEFGEVTGVTSPNATTAVATFTWRVNLLPGQSPPGGGVDLNATHAGEAQFQKFDDGWRLINAVNSENGFPVL